MRRILALIFGLALIGLAALAQDPATDPGGQREGDGFLANLLTNQLSGPGRVVQLQGITGALSSRARIAEITVSDEAGPWLRLRGVEIDWSRAALLLGRVNVNRLGIEQIDFLRRAVAPEPTLADRLPAAEATPFSLPELPVSVNVRELDLARISIAEAAFGQAAELAATGRLELAGGVLDTALDIARQDGPGGNLALAAAFSNDTRNVSIDFDLSEPAGGLVATLLDLENRPAIALRVAGAGPVDALDVTFAFDAGTARIADGGIELRGEPEGLGFAATLQGAFAPVVPSPYRPFFAGQTRLRAEGTSLAAGGLRLAELAIEGAALDLTGSLSTTPDGFPRTIALAGRIGDARGPAVTLPVAGAATRLHSAILYLNYGDGQRWNGLLALDRLVAGDVEIEDLTLDLGGAAENLDDPAQRRVTLAMEGVATGVWSPDADLARLLGTRLDLFADLALPAEAPLALRQVQISGNGLSVFAAGTLDGLAFRGRTALRVADISPAAGLAGRPLGGSVDIRTDGIVDPLNGTFDMTLAGTTEDLRLGQPNLDGLLAGTTLLEGGLARDTGGFRAEALRLSNPQALVTADGVLSSRNTDIALEASVRDLSAVDARLAGSAVLRAEAEGAEGPVALRVLAEGTDTTLAERPLDAARLTFEGSLDGTDLQGALRGGADFAGQPIRLSADLDLAGDERAVSGVLAEVGPNRLTGDASQTGGGAVVGRFILDAPDVAPLAALALTEASGAVRANIELQAAQTGQEVALDASVTSLALGANRIGSLALDARALDAFGVPIVDGTIAARDMRVAGIDIATLDAAAEQTDAATTQVEARTRLAIGTEAEATGQVTRLPDGIAVTLASLGLRQQEVSARLRAPATITRRNGTVQLSPLALDVGSGSLTAAGSAGKAFDLTLDIDGLPLSIANAVQPALGLEGTLTGSARIDGTRTAPDASFDLVAAGLASGQTRSAGLPPIEVTARGRTEAARLRLDAALAAQGLDARANGTLPLGRGSLALDVTLASLPLALIDQLAGSQGLAGTITGTGRIGGTTSAPEASFDLNGSGITARPLQQNGIAPLGLALRGGFAGNALQLGSAEVSNDQGLALSASGRAPLAGPGLDLRATGAVPLSLANALLDERSAEASGLARVDVTVTGSISAPRYGGTLRVDQGAFFDPITNVRLENLTAEAGLEGQSVVLRALSAGIPSGGAIEASGTVSLAAAQGYPADLALRFLGVRYTDGVFVTTQIDGELTVQGPLTGGGVVGGRIDLGPTEISVAEGFGGAAQGLVDEVVHLRPPPRVLATLDRARVREPDPPVAGGRGALRTDVLIRAPNQIFVRGRGLDVELGGELRVTGPTTDIVPVGQFDLRRGRIQLLGQRIDFDEGSLQLTGNLDPQVDFVARTRSDDVTAIITVAGRVSSPEITFSSQPSLPEDEVLARIIFNRSVGNLSAFQVAQLAAAAAELAGAGGGSGILDTLRGAIGVDDLDIVTEEDGQTAVRAGTYIDDNIYLDLQAEQDGDTRARVNLDVNDNVTLRGSVGSDGNSTVGVFFERDY